ncbi:zinc ABC transporter substrate-binding protein ZnuA [Candidatus Pantoea edessiphila]|uniref:High-affinity zinc uptake system protein ZnuA n=1 Tax=Candidatus Pantoea edessiphila TaxID=2044610 RepID=A0A2P5SWP8_9GAMM|nr:zinc ABC transporter substrate-binding protein ZnuA [Candidatus Pantoea edessiphila]PPI86759.1 zinc ABC transporter substrate-binding protein [Candidatus Pantoea edessiphila]
MIYKNFFSNILIHLILSYLIVFYAHANILVSIKPIGFIASAIADGIMPVDILVPNGASEHSYILRPSDEKKLQDTDLLIWNGPDAEPFMAKSVFNISSNKTIVLTDIKEIQKFFIPINSNNCKDNSKHVCKNNVDSSFNSKTYNIHFWTSPDVARNIAITIHKKLLQLMPQKKDKLNENLKQFELSLNNTDKKIMIELAPIRNKGYFVFHDAYVYFEKHYGLSSMGYFTKNPEIQPGLKHLYEIKKTIKENKVVCIFSEPQFKVSVIDSLIKGTKVNQGVLDPLGSNIKLSKDSYLTFLLQLSNQYQSCLKNKK